MPQPWWVELKENARVPVGEARHLEGQPETIPIVLVPDTFATRLKNKGGKKVWEPDSTGFMLWQYGMLCSDAAAKKELLVGDAFNEDDLAPCREDHTRSTPWSPSALAAVDAQTAAHPRWRSAAERGWTEISWERYGDLLRKLQAPETWTDEQPLIADCFRFPVHAFGYNWAASHASSGEKLAKMILELVRTYNKKENNKKEANEEESFCEQVILVTDGAGGLVARDALTRAGVEGRVLGAIHAAQPVNGSPMWYWRFKAGFERPKGSDELPGAFLTLLSTPTATAYQAATGTHSIKKLLTGALASADAIELVTDTADISDLKSLLHVARIVVHPRRSARAIVGAWELGTNGAEVTAVLGWMPGILEQLPTSDYTDNSGNRNWLRVLDRQGNPAYGVTDAYGFPAWTDASEALRAPRQEYGGDGVWENVYMNDDEAMPWRLIDKRHLVPKSWKKRLAAQVVAGLRLRWMPELNEVLDERKATRAAFDGFCARIRAARSFHRRLAGRHHPETRALYGDGKTFPTCDRIEYRAETWHLTKKVTKEVVGLAKLTLAGIGASVVPVFGWIVFGLGVGLWALEHTQFWQLRGAFKATVRTADGTLYLELRHPDDVARADRGKLDLRAGQGDGTVPVSSGSALQQTGSSLPRDGAKARRQARAARPIEALAHDRVFRSDDDAGKEAIALVVRAVRNLCVERIRTALQGEVASA